MSASHRSRALRSGDLIERVRRYGGGLKGLVDEARQCGITVAKERRFVAQPPGRAPASDLLIIQRSRKGWR